MGLNTHAGLTIEGRGKLVAIKAGCVCNFDQNASVCDPASIDEMRDLKLRKKIKASTTELFGCKDRRDWRLRVKHRSGIAQQTVEVSLAEALSCQLCDLFVMLHDELT